MSDEKVEKKTRNNLNPDGLPTPSMAEFIYHFNQSKSRADAVKRMKDAGFHMTYNNLCSREKTARKLVGDKIKTVTKSAPRKLDKEDVLAELDRLEQEAVAEASE
jgi:hypothetical protein